MSADAGNHEGRFVGSLAQRSSTLEHAFSCSSKLCCKLFLRRCKTSIFAEHWRRAFSSLETSFETSIFAEHFHETSIFAKRALACTSGRALALRPHAPGADARASGTRACTDTQHARP